MRSMGTSRSPMRTTETSECSAACDYSAVHTGPPVPSCRYMLEIQSALPGWIMKSSLSREEEQQGGCEGVMASRGRHIARRLVGKSSTQCRERRSSSSGSSTSAAGLLGGRQAHTGCGRRRIFTR